MTQAGKIAPAAEAGRAHAPADHPPVPPARIGVVLANLGTPDATDYWSMRRYLDEFLSDRRVIDYPRWKWQPLLQLVILTRRPFTSGRQLPQDLEHRGRREPAAAPSPATQTAAVAARLAERHGDRVVVDFAMRYGNPSTASVIERLQAAGCERIVFFPLYPQYSAATTATANDAGVPGADGAALAAGGPHRARLPRPSALHRGAGAVGGGGLRRPRRAARRARHQLPRDAGALPAEGDPYHCHCHKTTRLLRDAARARPTDEVVVTFQSRFGTEEWLKPYTVEEVARLAQAGKRHIAMMAPAFSADCVETLEEINEEIREAFLARGRRGLHLHPLPERRRGAHRR